MKEKESSSIKTQTTYLSDEQVMDKIKTGRAEMLAILFERHHIKLFNFLCRLTQNRNVSEDLVQEAFFRILKFAKTYQGKSKFTVWMFTIAKNLYIDHLRKNKNNIPLEDHQTQQATAHPLPDDTLQIEQEKSLLLRALAELPDRKREMIILSRFKYMNYQQIAELYNMKLSLIKVTVYRGMRDLKRIYLRLKEGAA